MRLRVNTFRAGSDKEAALKPLEEAAEAYAAWQRWVSEATPGGLRANAANHRALADEIADTVTACANLAERWGIDLQAALERVERKNVERGRYV